MKKVVNFEKDDGKSFSFRERLVKARSFSIARLASTSISSTLNSSSQESEVSGPPY